MSRTVLAISGSDRVEFLQGLVTNDVEKAKDGIVYAALLTPQGKFIADFFLIGEADRILVDVAQSHAVGLAQRLSMYRLRADVQITETDVIVSRGIGSAPEGALADPRHEDLGWRHYGTSDISEVVDWDAIRVALTVPETGAELTPESYILEMGFERLNGVDFKKGCFVGQEIVARMKHKTELRKGLARVAIDGKAQANDDVLNGEKPVGVLHTVSDTEALAYLRFDRASGEMQTESAKITLLSNS